MPLENTTVKTETAKSRAVFLWGWKAFLGSKTRFGYVLKSFCTWNLCNVLFDFLYLCVRILYHETWNEMKLAAMNRKKETPEPRARTTPCGWDLCDFCHTWMLEDRCCKHFETSKLP